MERVRHFPTTTQPTPLTSTLCLLPNPPAEPPKPLKAHPCAVGVRVHLASTSQGGLVTAKDSSANKDHVRILLLVCTRISFSKISPAELIYVIL